MAVETTSLILAAVTIGNAISEHNWIASVASACQKPIFPQICFAPGYSTQVGQVAVMEAVLLWESHQGCNYNMQDLGKVW